MQGNYRSTGVQVFSYENDRCRAERMLPLVPSDCCPAMTTRRPNKRRKGLGVVTADHPSPYIILGGVTRPGQHSQNKHMQNTTSTIFAHLTDCQLLADPGNHVGGG